MFRQDLHYKTFKVKFVLYVYIVLLAQRTCLFTHHVMLSELLLTFEVNTDIIYLPLHSLLYYFRYNQDV